MKVFIIAEAGINHNGSLELAKELIRRAAESGCDAIKFQSYKTANLVTKEAKKAAYQNENIGDSEVSQFEMLNQYEISEGDFGELHGFAQSEGIEFLSTPFDEESLQYLENMGVRRYKISSGDLTNKPLLEKASRTRKPIILSTGMATVDEVRDAVSWCRSAGALDISLLHCTSQYPTEFTDVNMLAMDLLRDEFHLPVGYSDHTIGLEVPIMAVARGATIIEKHITLSNEMDGPDHKASLEVKDLPRLVSSIRHVETAFGKREKKPTDEERETAKVVRKGVVSRKALRAGQVISRDDITLKRPAGYIPPACIEEIVGCIVARDIAADEPISWGDLRK